ncbi:serine/threonine protein kinase [Streptomyces sp. NPDC002574]|uniref:serine/threonine protein kinase n=1 Tax=Streptomyces sp. NPDC002574 TaxID=3364652 RepID=UPI00367DC087
MAERSPAAVGVANESGDKPLTAHADDATADEATDLSEEQDAPQETLPEETAPTRNAPPELHSGHKLARRYRLEDCLTRVDGFSSWKAFDEKLRRAVGIHILPADHGRARSVLAAARSAALLGDPRFVQVLDAVEENDLVYVIHEWLPDARELTELIAADALEPHEAYQMVSQVAQAMAAAHREGLAHLRLNPDAVLRTEAGQYRIRGLAVAAALRGISSERPQREDTEAIGALLYACLTQRWPYAEDAYGLSGLPKDVGLVAPDKVRAGIHRGLSELAMRALVNDGATASREPGPCATPEELAKAVAATPKIRPPEPSTAPYSRTTYQQGAYRQSASHPSAHVTTVLPATPPPALTGRTGRALKWSVSALLIAAIGLGSWQVAETLMDRENQSKDGGTSTAPPTGGGDDPSGTAQLTSGKPIAITGAKDFDPLGTDGSENPRDVPNAYDGKPSTFWETSWYTQANLGGLKSGVGVIVDLGSVQRVGKVKVDFIGDDTSADLMAASSGADSMPTGLDDFTKVASASGGQASFTPGTAVRTRYLLVWLTQLPRTDQGNYRGRISEIKVSG